MSIYFSQNFEFTRACLVSYSGHIMLSGTVADPTEQSSSFYSFVTFTEKESEVNNNNKIILKNQ